MGTGVAAPEEFVRDLLATGVVANRDDDGVVQEMREQMAGRADGDIEHPRAGQRRIVVQDPHHVEPPCGTRGQQDVGDHEAVSSAPMMTMRVLIGSRRVR